MTTEIILRPRSAFHDLAPSVRQTIIDAFSEADLDPVGFWGGIAVFEASIPTEQGRLRVRAILDADDRPIIVGAMAPLDAALPNGLPLGPPSHRG